MFRKILMMSIPVMALLGCNQESPSGNPSGPSESNPSNTTEIRSLEKLVDIKVGEKSVTLYKGPEQTFLVEAVQPKGEPSLLTPEMNGWNWKQIQEKLAPGQKAAEGLEAIPFHSQESIGTPAPIYSGEGNISTSLTETGPGPLAKTAADAGWFQTNFCTNGNAFSWCLLNRSGGDDWGWSNCKMSFINIIVNFGVQIQLKIKIGGSNTLTTTILNDNYVHSWTSTSGKNWLGLIKQETHRYDITNTAGSGWHWSVRAETW